MTVAVKRDGTVTRDGQTIGRVEKEIRQGIFATVLGAAASASGTPYWVPFDADGKKLADGYDTRKRAVGIVDAVSQPMTVDSIKVEQGWLSGRPFVSAWLKMKGYSFGVSRYASESVWVVDCQFNPGSMMPVFSNGSGTRVTSAYTLKGDAADAVTKAAIEAGVWPLPEQGA